MPMWRNSEIISFIWSHLFKQLSYFLPPLYKTAAFTLNTTSFMVSARMAGPSWIPSFLPGWLKCHLRAAGHGFFMDYKGTCLSWYLIDHIHLRTEIPFKIHMVLESAPDKRSYFTQVCFGRFSTLPSILALYSHTRLGTIPFVKTT